MTEKMTLTEFIDDMTKAKLEPTGLLEKVESNPELLHEIKKQAGYEFGDLFQQLDAHKNVKKVESLGDELRYLFNDGVTVEIKLQEKDGAVGIRTVGLNYRGHEIFKGLTVDGIIEKMKLEYTVTKTEVTKFYTREESSQLGEAYAKFTDIISDHVHIHYLRKLMEEHLPNTLMYLKTSDTLAVRNIDELRAFEVKVTLITNELQVKESTIEEPTLTLPYKDLPESELVENLKYVHKYLNTFREIPSLKKALESLDLYDEEKSFAENLTNEDVVIYKSDNREVQVKLGKLTVTLYEKLDKHYTLGYNLKYGELFEEEYKTVDDLCKTLHYLNENKMLN